MKRLLAGLLALSFSAMADVLPFTPVLAGTKTLSVTTSSAATALPTSVLFQGQLQLTNAGANAAFCETGDSTVTAAVATGYPILVGQTLVITAPQTITHIACITGTSTATVYVTIGRGN